MIDDDAGIFNDQQCTSMETAVFEGNYSEKRSNWSGQL